MIDIFIFVLLLSTLFISLVSLTIYFFSRSKSTDLLALEEENQAYLLLNSDEQELYFQLKEYLSSTSPVCGDLSLLASLSIQEKGISAYEFIKDPMLTSSDLIIVDKTELNFFKDFESSVQTNLPLPLKNDVYYYECKIYLYSPTTTSTISLGLSTKPYPWFRLPGRHPNSISYDSNGSRRFNQPFPQNSYFPPLIQGDVIGIGYRTRSSTLFFTRNGKKINESKLGGHVKGFKFFNKNDVLQLFPTIGANCLCSVHVNLGQAGFVFIEANVKKWGLAPLEGNGPSPPAYNKFNGDILLERSEIGDDFSDRENDFPPNFFDDANDNDKFSYNPYSDVDPDIERITMGTMPGIERITMGTMPGIERINLGISDIDTNEPPSYNGSFEGSTGRDNNTTATNIMINDNNERLNINANEAITVDEYDLIINDETHDTSC